MSEQRPILVTGATGAQGRAAIRHLLAHGMKVRAMSRDPQKPGARQLAARGVEVVAGDLDDLESLKRATDGAYGVFAVQNFWEKGVGFHREIEQGRLLAVAAEAAGVSHNLQTSVASCERAPGVQHFESKWHIEAHVDRLGLPRTFLREVFFMENFTEPLMGLLGKRRVRPHWVLPVMRGALAPETALHMVAVDDIGRFAADIFAHPERYLGTKLDLAGDCLTVAEMTRVIEEVTGRAGPPFKVPSGLMRWLNPEMARQFQWNNDVGWSIDIRPLRARQPQLMTFRQFLERQLTGDPQAHATQTPT